VVTDEPQGKTRVAWWVAALAILVTVVVVALVREAGDGELDEALLTGAEFGAGYDVAVMTSDDVVRADADVRLPSGIEPAECAELLRARPEPADTEAVGGVSARGQGSAYLELVMPADGVPLWDTERLDEVVGTCSTTTFDTGDGTGDGTGTVEFSRLDVPVTDGFALAARVSSGDGVVTVGVAVSRVADHVVVLTGVAEGDLDRAEFTRLVRAASERVSAHL
jgi:hypothetical protein